MVVSNKYVYNFDTDKLDIVTDENSLNSTFQASGLYAVSGAYQASGNYLKVDTSNDPLTGDLEISKSTPELRLTDTGDNEYGRVVRTSANKELSIKNYITKLSAATDEIPTMVSNISPAGSASANNIYNSDYMAYKAMDDNASTMWLSLGATGAHWLRYQFLTSKAISRYTLKARPDSAFNQAFNNFVFQGGNTGSTWTTLDTQTGLSWTIGEKKTFDIPNTTSYIYYQVSGTSAGGYGAFAEFELINTNPMSEEVNIINSKNSSETGIEGIQTFGDINGRTIVDGATVAINIAGIEKAKFESGGRLVGQNFYMSGNSYNAGSLFAGSVLSPFISGTTNYASSYAGSGAFVPYTGAISGLNLGTKNFITTGSVTSTGVTNLGNFYNSGNQINVGSLTSFNNLISSGLSVKGSASIVSDLIVSGNCYLKIPYGIFSSTETQTGSPINTSLPITFNTVEDTHQMSISGGSVINFVQAGDYMVNISAIAENTSPTAGRIQIWPCKNGSNVPRSNTIYDFKGQNTYAVISVPFILDIGSGDTFCMRFASSNEGVRMPYTGSTAYSPSTLSIIMTINKISDITL